MFKFSLALLLFTLALPATAEQVRDATLRDPTLRDPTRPLSEAAPVQHHETSFQLNAILSGAQRSNVAIINGKTVAEGDSVEGARVLRILADRVSLQYQGRSLELRLHSTSVRTSSVSTSSVSRSSVSK